MDQPIELIVGIVFLLVGTSMIVRKKEWKQLTHYFAEKGAPLVLLTGSIDILIGSMIVGFHWIWSGASAITTAIGAWLFIRGCVRIFCPIWVAERIKNFTKGSDSIFWIAGLIILIASTIILSNWCQYSCDRVLVIKDLY